MKGIAHPCKSGQSLLISLDPITTVPYKFELAKIKSVRESRVIFLVSVLSEYSQAFPEPEV